MSGQQSFNVSNVVDNQPIRKIMMLVFVLCFCAMLSDGYDLGVVGLAAPGIVKNFHIARSQMSPVFSAALFGMLVGALSSGFLGDRFGRKRGIMLACLIISLASFGCSAAGTFSSLIWFRFFAGIGLGGLLPNVTALMAEFLPQKVRGTFTTFTFMGITFGGILPGVVSSQIVNGDWRDLFLIGGFVPLVVLPLVYVFLPESLKFLALHPNRQAELRQSLRRVSADIDVPPGATFVLDEVIIQKFALSSLFADGLKFITPFLWVAFITIMLVNFFINSWLTLVLRDMGFTNAQAAATVSLYYVGGVCGGLLIGPALDYIGPVILALYAVFGCVITALIGLPNSTQFITHILVFLVGFSVLGAQVGMSSTAGLLYPTAIRSKGAGFAHSIGRFGAIGGPLLAGFLIAQHATLTVLFIVPAIPLAIAACAFLLITRLWTGKVLGLGLARLRKDKPAGIKSALPI
jgi:MFS transporter, AAHS family, 4-hydroxybenzoate transporter